MMGRKCIVLGCHSGYNNTKNISLFSIPKNKIEQWQKVIPRKNCNLITSYAGICENHFNKSDIIRKVTTETYTYELKHPRLAEDAVPCIFTNGSTLTNIESIPLKQEVEETCTVNTEELTVIKTEPLSVEEPPKISLFTVVWGKGSIMLPSGSWAIHFISELNPVKQVICISKMSSQHNRVFLQKKVVLSDQHIDCYVFESLIHLENSEQIITLENLENFLEYFDKLRVCAGALKISQCSKHFESKHFFIDSSNVWRHKQCKYVITQGKKCGFCKTMPKAVYERNKKEALKLLKTELMKKNLKRTRLQNSRLKKRISSIKDELKTYRQKPKEDDHQ